MSTPAAKSAMAALEELERLCQGAGAGYLELLARAKLGVTELDRALGQLQRDVRRAWGVSRGEIDPESKRRPPR